MTPEDLTRLLASNPGRAPERAPDCPDEHLVAAYVDGALDPPARQALETHLADCDCCLATVGVLSRELGAHTAEQASQEDPPQERTVRAAAAHRRWRLAPQWAIAAAMVLAVPLLLHTGRNPERGIEGQGRPAPPVTRNRESNEPGLRVLSVGPGSSTDPSQIVLRWTEVPGTPYYEVRIVTDEGDVIVRQRVTGTSWRLSPDLALRPGSDYYALVEAYPAGDKSVSSEHVPFRAGE